MKTLILLFFPVLLSAQTTRTEWEKEMQRRQGVFDRYAPPYEVGRAMLPGVLAFVGGAMPDTKRGRIWQQGLFFTAGVSIGGWDNTTTKQKLIYAGCAVSGAAAGFIVRNNTK